MSITANDAFTSIEDVRKDLSDLSDATKLRAANYINQDFYRVWYEEEPEKFITSETISVVANTNTYSLPSDIETIQEDGCGLYEVDADGNDTSTQKVKTGFGSAREGYYINGSNSSRPAADKTQPKIVS